MTDGQNWGWQPEQGNGRHYGQGHVCVGGYAGPDGGRTAEPSNSIPRASMGA